MKSFWILCLVLFVKHISGEEEQEITDDDPFCFRYTWLYPIYDVESKVAVNCSTFKGVPCINPVFDTPEPPDIEDLLEDYNKTYIGCALMPGYFCMRYTFKYNNELVNVSRFCGKLIEDEMSVSSRCYTQYVDGHTIEACACRSVPGETPCNGAMYTKFSLTLTLFGVLISIINVLKFEH